MLMLVSVSYEISIGVDISALALVNVSCDVSANVSTNVTANVN